MNFDKVLITGADGMVGSYIDFGIKTNRRSLDITDLKETLSIIEKYKPEAIINLAAETDVDRCERDPEYAYFVNSIGAYHVAYAARKIGAKLVHISTAGVFDGEKERPYNEEDIPNPQNYYGHSKYLGELAIREMLPEGDFIIARAGWMFGGGPKKDQKFVAKIIKQFDQKTIFAVNDKIGSPTYAKDLVGAIKKLLEDNKSGIYHLCNYGVCSRYDVALKIKETLKSDIEIKSVDSSYFNLDANRTKSEAMDSRVKIMRPWEDALADYLRTEWNHIN